MSNVSTKPKEPNYQIGVNSKQFCHDNCGKLVKEPKQCFCIPPNNPHTNPQIKPAQLMPTETIRILSVQSVVVKPEPIQLVQVKQGDYFYHLINQQKFNL
jgi:hypothetical protein